LTTGTATRLAAVWFADIVGYSRLASRDEKAALGLVDVLRSVLNETLQQYDGRLVKLMGDGALVEFASADAAVRSALDLVRRFAERGGALVPASRLRVGVHVGEVAPGPDGDLYGDGVNTAARLQQSAGPGEVVVSEDVWRSLRQRPDHRFTPLGQRRLKGLAVSVRIFRAEPAEAVLRPWDGPVGWLRRAVRRRAVVYAAVASLVGLAGYGLLSWDRASGGPDSAGGITSLAVLPLANLNPDTESEYFADGMTEELISALSRVEGLRVVSRTSAFTFKGRNADVREVGEELGVGSVLEGSVRRAGNQLRITVQLVDTRNGYQLWSDTYDRELADVFAIQEEISQAVVRALGSRLGAAGSSASRGPLARTGTDDLGAYELYLQGRYLTNKWGEESVRRGIAYFERAIEKDPDFARAYAGLADAYMWLLWDGSVQEALPLAREAAQRALELDDSLSEAHYANARVASEIDWDWPTAEEEFRRALELDPANGEARHRYAHLLVALQRYAEATAESRRLIELDPLNAEWHHHLGWNYLFSGQYDLAEAPYRKALELDPNVLAGRAYLGVLLVKQARFPEAIEMFQEDIERHGANGETLSHLAWGHAMAGDRAAARAILADINRRGIRVAAWRRAYVHAALGEKDHAFEWLEQAFVERRALFQFARDPRFDPLRDDPRFAQIVRRMNLAP
jgi:TolB-like protein/class 3 adenylate cyclase/Tfp pilus assembly protein PilF